MRFKRVPLPHGTYYPSSPFGPRWGKNHGGLDLAAKRGVPIYAAVDGYVTQGWDPLGGGWWTGQVTAEGDYVGYGHASAYADPDGAGPAVNFTGRWVPAGTVIAYVGSTGTSTGDHLHLAVRPAGARGYVDPAPYLREAETAGLYVGRADPATPSPSKPPATHPQEDIEMPLSPETRKEITELVQLEFVNQDTRWRAYFDEMFGRVTRQLDPNGNPPAKDGLPIRSLVEEVVNWVRSK